MVTKVSTKDSEVNQNLQPANFQEKNPSIGCDDVAGWIKARSNKSPRLTPRQNAHLAFVVSHTLLVDLLIIDLFLGSYRISLCVRSEEPTLSWLWFDHSATCMEADMAGTPTGVANVRYRPASYAHLRCERNMSRHITQVTEVHQLGSLDTRPK